MAGEAEGLGGHALSTAVNSGSRRWRRKRERERGRASGERGGMEEASRAFSRRGDEDGGSMRWPWALPACMPRSGVLGRPGKKTRLPLVGWAWLLLAGPKPGGLFFVFFLFFSII